MQSIKKLHRILEELSDSEHYLFTLSDLHTVFPEHRYGAFKALMSRAARAGELTRVCNGVYLNPRVAYPRDRILYHTAAKLRARHFNYVSLETVLSEAGVISQIPIQWISVMSSGRSNTIDCGEFGSIEFVHTKKSPLEIADRLVYDGRYGLWKATVDLALQDMRTTGRPADLIDPQAVHEELKG